MTTIEQVVQGITSEQMTLEELKTLATENNIDLGKSTKKIDVLAKVQEWEESLQVEKEPVTSNEVTRHKAGVLAIEDLIVVEFHENKKVVSKRDIEINGKMYSEITVEGGIVFTELKK